MKHPQNPKVLRKHRVDVRKVFDNLKAFGADALDKLGDLAEVDNYRVATGAIALWQADTDRLLGDRVIDEALKEFALKEVIPADQIKNVVYALVRVNAEIRGGNAPHEEVVAQTSQTRAIKTKQVKQIEAARALQLRAKALETKREDLLSTIKGVLAILPKMKQSYQLLLNSGIPDDAPAKVVDLLEAAIKDLEHRNRGRQGQVTSLRSLGITPSQPTAHTWRNSDEPRRTRPKHQTFNSGWPLKASAQ